MRRPILISNQEPKMLREYIASLLTALAAAPSTPAQAIEQPQQHKDFCERSPAHCERIGTLDRMELNIHRLAELDEINRRVNRAITPRLDSGPDIWEYPKSGAGDCEDYVIAKRAALINRGWSSSQLLMTVVHTGTEGHAVLLARTSGGDFVLDNMTDSVMKPFATGYTFMARQSHVNPVAWVSY